jgi:hypothetical protein
MRPLGLALTAGMMAAAGCAGEVTGVSTVPAYVTWIEWPTAVTATRPGALRLSGYAVCPYQLTFGITVSGTEIHVEAVGRRPAEFGICMDLHVAGGDVAGGAGYDTLLPLPRLMPPTSELPVRFQLFAPMMSIGSAPPGDEIIGGLDLRAAEDTATQFAGRALIAGDSAGCWRLTPFARYPVPHWVFAKPLSLAPRSYGYSGFVTGRFVRVNPPICGDSIAVQATRVEVDVTPWGARQSR